MSGEYLTPSGYGEAEFAERRSRFIGRVWRAESEAEALERIKETRERHRDASHNVYAYIIREGGLARYSDDGEPQGSSGLPALGALRAAGVADVCCVVTRYFGGVLLGTGGLARAYSRAAALALEAAGLSRVARLARLRLSCPYQFYERVRRELALRGALVEDERFGAAVELSVRAESGEAEALVSRLAEISSGAVVIERAGEEYGAVPLK